MTSVRPPARMPGLQAHELEEEQHTDQAKDDGGDARQGLCGKLDDRHHVSVGGILGQVDGRAHAQGQDDDHRQQDDIEGIQKVGQDPDGVADIAGLAGQQRPADVAAGPDRRYSR